MSVIGLALLALSAIFRHKRQKNGLISWLCKEAEHRHGVSHLRMNHTPSGKHHDVYCGYSMKKCLCDTEHSSKLTEILSILVGTTGLI